MRDVRTIPLAEIRFDEAASRYPGRFDVRDAVWSPPGEEPVPVVVKRVPRSRRDRIKGVSRAELSYAMARHLLERGVETPEPLGILETEAETWFIARKIEGAQQIRAWFRHRYEPGVPPPLTRIAFEDVVLGLGNLARRMHDGGVFFRDFTDGNVLVSRTETGDIRLSLVDLDRARIYRKPLGILRRSRDLARPGINTLADRRLFIESYEGQSATALVVLVTGLRARIRAWDWLKKVLRPWRRAR